MARQPQRFTGRAGSGSPGRVRRSLDAAIDTDRRNGESLEVRDGRLEVRFAKGAPFKTTSRGLEFDPGVLGDKNRDPMKHIVDLDSAATTAEAVSKLNELLAELRRTKRLQGFGGA